MATTSAPEHAGPSEKARAKNSTQAASPPREIHELVFVLLSFGVGSCIGSLILMTNVIIVALDCILFPAQFWKKKEDR